MNVNKKITLLFIYFLLVAIILIINSNIIVDLFNKSLVDEYIKEGEPVKPSYNKGSSVIFLISLFIYSLVGGFIVSLIISNTFWLIFIFANKIKVEERNEFITFKELYTITSPKDLIALVDLPWYKPLTILLILFIFLLVIHKITKKAACIFNFNVPIKVRLIILIISLVPLILIYVAPNTYNKYILKFEEEQGHNFYPVGRAQKAGFIPSFINTMNPIYMDKPAEYNKKNIMKIKQKYEKLSNVINSNRKKPLNNTLTIYYASETLIDPMTFPDLIINDTPIPYISRILEEHISGTIFSQYIGGGTANIEWTVLTSFSLEVFNDPISITPFSDFYSYSKNHQTVLTFFDKEKIAIHPYTAHLYKRKTIYPLIGFDDFLYLDNGIQHVEKLGTHTRISDAALNKDLLREAQQDNVGFIHVLSMQNHAPYTGEIPEMEYIPEVNTSIYPEESKQELINYLQGLKATDIAIEELINELEQFNDEVNLIIYGDHSPSLFRGLEDTFSAELLHHTPWFIYMNNQRNVNGTKYEQVSPIFLTTILLKEGNYFVSPFQSLMDELLDSGVKRIGKNYIYTENGKVSDNDVDKELLELIQDYRMIMYDALFGSNWLSQEFYKAN